MTHSMYAHIVVYMLYVCAFIGVCILVRRALRTISPYTHAVVHAWRTNTRSMDTTHAMYMNKGVNK